ncbi:MAG: ABC transporter ATP-binding protein [Deltaproteobacteria bacterium]|nr:ABC transporter ATP-binding protein [Deltaproteobacteria bacterium]
MIRISGLKKWFKTRDGSVAALRGLELEVAEGEFCVLLGPSGCGKTTTLRCVAGLEKPDGGEIEISGTKVTSSSSRVHIPTEKRDIGMVFQSYAIWPHMNVFQNVAFPLVKGRRHIPKQQVAEKVRRALALVQLDHMEDRPATDLSGGQQQRVAMARAVVTEPKILLMDEPLSNLDARLREQMRLELKKITESVGVTTLYVTHDQAEALSLGDKVCAPGGLLLSPESVCGTIRGRDELYPWEGKRLRPSGFPLGKSVLPCAAPLWVGEWSDTGHPPRAPNPHAAPRWSLPDRGSENRNQKLPRGRGSVRSRGR